MHPSSSQASDSSSPYSKYPERDENPNIPENREGDRNRKERSDDIWRGEYGSGDRGDDERDGKDDDNKDDGKESPRKVPKKTEVACHFCRGRKLKCDGNRPSCLQCARRGQACKYDESVRRRGPGRKNKGGVELPRRQRGRIQESEALTSLSTPIPSSSAFQYLPPPSYQTPTPLPGPPIPQYNFELGQISPTPPRLSTGPLQSSEDSSRTHGQHMFHGDHPYPQPPYTRPSHYDQQHRPEYSQASTSGYSSQIGNAIYHGEQSAERETLGYAVEEADDEGASRPRLKRRRTSSPPEDSPSSSKKRRYSYVPDKDDHIR